MHIATRDLKDHLSEYLKRVQAGEEITITSHGKPVAKLSPPDAVKVPRPDPLANVAWIRRPTRQRQPGERFGLPPDQRIVMTPGPTMSEIVLQYRE